METTLVGYPGNRYSPTPNCTKMHLGKYCKTHDDEKSDGTNKLIAFEGRIPEVILAKDTLRGPEACVNSHINTFSLQRSKMVYKPQVAMEIADVAARDTHAALPRSRGGILLCSSVGSFISSSAGDRSETEPILNRMWDLEVKRVLYEECKETCFCVRFQRDESGRIGRI
jgi:hypothetical protein